MFFLVVAGIINTFSRPTKRFDAGSQRHQLQKNSLTASSSFLARIKKHPISKSYNRNYNRPPVQQVEFGLGFKFFVLRFRGRNVQLYLQHRRLSQSGCVTGKSWQARKRCAFGHWNHRNWSKGIKKSKQQCSGIVSSFNVWVVEAFAIF